MRCAVAIFAKTVGLSSVKTRLAADIGKEQAEEFYTLSVECVESFVSQAGEAFPEVVYPVWVIGEEAGLSSWDARSFPAIWTGEGGLGSRLANVSEHLFATYDAVMMIGTDSPQLAPSVIIDAISRLAGGLSDCVVGPADDGGFYLFASKMPVAREIWERVEYSKETTLAELMTLLEQDQRSIGFLESEQDVDALSDLVSLKSVLQQNHKILSHAQSTLLTWLDQRI